MRMMIIIILELWLTVEPSTTAMTPTEANKNWINRSLLLHRRCCLLLDVEYRFPVQRRSLSSPSFIRQPRETEWATRFIIESTVDDTRRGTVWCWPLIAAEEKDTVQRQISTCAPTTLDWWIIMIRFVAVAIHARQRVKQTRWAAKQTEGGRGTAAEEWLSLC